MKQHKPIKGILVATLAGIVLGLLIGIFTIPGRNSDAQSSKAAGDYVYSQLTVAHSNLSLYAENHDMDALNKAAMALHHAEGVCLAFGEDFSYLSKTDKPEDPKWCVSMIAYASDEVDAMGSELTSVQEASLAQLLTIFAPDETSGTVLFSSLMENTAQTDFHKMLFCPIVKTYND